ncbi:MAG: hypothetical protein LBJ15_24800 [Comamonas sp.]|uniref:hypothetical protein n=1 Tax=Comamonas sp. TaxID=34028 RepID=UPI00281B5071|nr:hypothetical protein [Comamonas sp.]MDR0217204.1 hypothetical protein [Comamonas sp.]
MKGQILVFNEAMESGVILTATGQHLLFQEIDWQDNVPPKRGMDVEFTRHESNQAQHVRQIRPVASLEASPMASE